MDAWRIKRPGGAISAALGQSNDGNTTEATNDIE
jgi:hypothetical protein